MYSTHSRFPNACESYISVGDPYEKVILTREIEKKNMDCNERNQKVKEKEREKKRNASN